MNISGSTHTGLVRRSNQDSFCTENYGDFTVFAIADGMGGHNGGEFSSRMAIDSLKKFFTDRSDDDVFTNSACITNFIKTLNKMIYQRSVEDDSLRGMGTTLTLCVANSSVALFFHVGDSRAYIIPREGIIHQITKDHSLVQFMIDTKQITPEEAKVHPNRNIITRAVGTESPLEVDVFVVSISEGDRILLCSDGLTNMVEDDEISFIVRENDVESAVGKLITRANDEGGVDNITAVLYEG